MQLVRKRVLEFIKRNNLLSSGDTLIVAVSGGTDSVALLDILLNLPEFSLNLVVAHLNHSLRGDESDGDENFVRMLAEARGLPCVVVKLDIRNIAHKEGLSLEEAGRNARRSFLLKTAESYSASSVAFGHHRNDQAETVLMRLLRGAAASGLVGIRPKSLDGMFIRPLLALSRDEIAAYVKKGGLHFREDSSNSDLSFLRNRLRHELLPLLEIYNPETVALLNRTSDALLADEELLDTIVESEYAQISSYSTGQVTIDALALKKEPVALRKRVYRRAIIDLKGDVKRLSAINLEDVDRILMSSKGSGSIDLPCSITAVRQYEKMFFMLGTNDVVSPLQTIIIEKCGCYRISPGVAVHVEEYSGNLQDCISRDGDTLLVNAEMLPFPWMVRSYRAGDRFTPLGMSGRKKLKNLFVDKKIPSALRQGVPIFLQGDKIFWVGGLQQAEISRLDASEGRILNISLRHIVLS